MAIITIFGLAGTGTSTCGRALAKKIGYRFISTGDMIREMAKERGMSLYEFENVLKNDPSIDRELDLKIENIGRYKDGLVIDSRLAWHFIPHSKKIKFNCSNDVRIERVAKRDQISFDEASKKTLHREGLHINKYRELYGIENYEGDKNFDLVIDTTEITPDEILKKLERLYVI